MSCMFIPPDCIRPSFFLIIFDHYALFFSLCTFAASSLPNTARSTQHVRKSNDMSYLSEKKDYATSLKIFDNQFVIKKMKKNFFISEKCSTFALDFEKNMKKLRTLIVCYFALTFLSQSVGAEVFVTKKFENTPLREVVRTLEKKTHCTISYNENEVDVQKLITADYHKENLLIVVKRTFGRQYAVSMNGKNIMVSLKDYSSQRERPAAPSYDGGIPAQGVAAADSAYRAQLLAQHIDSIRTTYSIHTHSRLDTIFNITQHIETREVEPIPVPQTNRSHRFIAGVGTGYGEVHRNGHIAAQADVSYAYFFSPKWGIGLGIGADYYHSRRRYSDHFTQVGYTDSDIEPKATISVDHENMQRDERLLVLNLPVGVQMEYPVKNNRNDRPMYIYGAWGMRIGYPIMHQTTIAGECHKRGYYEKWDLTLTDMHEYTAGTIREYESIDVCPLIVAPQIEMGVAIPIGDKLDIGIGAYGNVSVWNKGDVFPWQVGAKLSLRWNKPTKAKPQPMRYEQVLVADTTWQVIEVVDTVRIAHYDTIWHPAEAITRVMEKSIIWFDLDKTIPKLDPPGMIDEIAAILVQYPEQKVEINGHTCDLGGKAYNERLSLRRAKAVYQLLLKRGVRPEQMKIQAFASSEPYYSKSHDRYLDRRVEIVPIANK